MKFPGRFEWKILGIVMLVAALSVGTVAYALRYVLKGVAASMREGRETGELSRNAEGLFRSYFAERKDEFRRRAVTIAERRPDRLSDLAGTEGLLRARRLRLREGQAPVVLDVWQAPANEAARLREAPAVVIEAPEGGSRLELVFGIPIEIYDEFMALGRALDLDRQRDQAFDAFVSRYIREYFVFVLGLLVVVPVIGFLFARRATRRVARLSEAARLVGQGDLTVRLTPEGRDELDDLARAFNGMVEELSEARSRLEYLQKVSAWQEVARRLAHEIKNPLTPVQLAVQELVSKYRGDDPAFQKLLTTVAEISKEEISALRRLVDDFSAFAKLPKVEPLPLDLGALLDDFVRHHPDLAGVVEVDPPPAPITVACDRIMFGRVLANLVENAVQAASAAGSTPRVKLSLTTESPYVVRAGASSTYLPRRTRETSVVDGRLGRRMVAICVDDNGPGVPADSRTRIFDPYVTTKPQGTGLGLAIVRKIVLDHGGDITVSPAPSPLGGARFVVELPLSAPT
jgi:two-component system nitrogen regulation sensor histidine kinase NtrY